MGGLPVSELVRLSTDELLSESAWSAARLLVSSSICRKQKGQKQGLDQRKRSPDTEDWRKKLIPVLSSSSGSTNVSAETGFLEAELICRAAALHQRAA